jgi:hypothetical protein
MKVLRKHQFTATDYIFIKLDAHKLDAGSGLKSSVQKLDFYLKCWEKHFVFENISVHYINITQKKLPSWYATHFLIQKACHDIFIVPKKFRKSWKKLLIFRNLFPTSPVHHFFYWKLIYSNTSSIKKQAC